MAPKKAFVRRKCVTAVQMNDLAEPEVTVQATAMPASVKTLMDVNAFFASIPSSTGMEPGDGEPSSPSLPPIIANKLALSAPEREIVLHAVVRTAGYFLNHPEMAQIGDCVLKVAEWGMVQDAKKVMGLLKGRPTDDGVGSADEAVMEGESAEVLQAIVNSARYLIRFPEMWRDDSAVAQAEVEVEESMVNMVVKIVGFLNGHPAADRLAVSKEVSEFIEWKREEMEMDGKT
jgi:hypothetical protein